MIYLYTDFGLNGPYVGQMKSVLAASGLPIIDLMHDVPAFNPKAGAYLLAAIVDYLEPNSVVLGIVDPGVGHPERRPIMIKADDRWYVGPDNGLFSQVVNAATTIECFEIKPGIKVSNSFHGRDVFAPAVTQLAQGQRPDSTTFNCAELLGLDWPNEVNEVIYFDHYGNAMTGLKAKNIDQNATIEVNGTNLSYAETFSSVPKSALFWYENSIGLVEISCNSGDAASVLDLSIGTRVIV